jgi:hypothetical protein
MSTSMPGRRWLRRPMLKIALGAIAFRAFSALLAFLVNLLFPDFQREPFTVFGSSSAFWDAFARWDSGWYYQIASRGYSYTPGGRDTIAWFPVYPMLMRHVGRLFGPGRSHIYIGGIVVSWIAFVLAMIAIYRLAAIDLPKRRAGRAVVFAAVFPFAFIFGAVYSEAVFLASTAATFYFFRTNRWVLGGVCGAIATATRVNGILMLPALGWIVWKGRAGAAVPTVPTGPAPLGQGAGADAEGPSAVRVSRALLGLALVPLGIVGYSLFIYRLTGNPLEWIATIERWNYHPGQNPWTALIGLAGQLVTRPYAFIAGGGMAPYDALNGIAAMALVAAVPFVWMRFGAAYGLFMAANLWLPLSSGQFEGLGRYCAVLFPFFIWLAAVCSRTTFVAVLVVFALLYTLCMALFVNIHPLY